MAEFGRDSNLALFIDFDNVAIGARESRQRFDVRLLLQRVLEKGKVVVKRAYADWHYYKEHMTPLHEAAIELIEVPSPKLSGKNSADIRLVVDAIDLCYAKSHIDTFVIVSGDSDFSPLVSKLRENDKRVIGIGVRSSSSHLLIANCDEFIFYDDIYNTAVTKLTEKVSSVPQDLRQLFDFLLQTTQSLLQESRGVLYSSLIKDTMKRKQPEFNETNYGYATFGELLEDARDRGLIEVERDSRAGGTLVVLGLGKGEIGLEGRSARSRRRRRDRHRKDDLEQPRPDQENEGRVDPVDAALPEVDLESPSAGIGDGPSESGDDQATVTTTNGQNGGGRSSRRGGRRRNRKKTRTSAAAAAAGAADEPSEPAPAPASAPAGTDTAAPSASSDAAADARPAGSDEKGAEAAGPARKPARKKAVKTPAAAGKKKTASTSRKKAATAGKAPDAKQAARKSPEAKQTTRKAARKAKPVGKKASGD